MSDVNNIHIIASVISGKKKTIILDLVLVQGLDFGISNGMIETVLVRCFWISYAKFNRCTLFKITNNSNIKKQIKIS